MKRSLVCALLVLPALLAAARPPQEGAVVSGRVTSADAGAAIPGATVVVEGLGIRAVTAADGRYVLRVPAEQLGAGGDYRVSASTLGRERAVRQVTLRPGTQATLDFLLASRAIALEGVVASATGEVRRARAVGSSVATLQGRAAGVQVRGSSPVTASGAPVVVGGAYSGGSDAESYAEIVENPFLAASANPLSTFSIDVDAASYSNVRRFLREGRLPPRDAVRIEEMVNYFTYDYPEPSGEHPFSVVAEVGECPWNPAHRLVHVGLQGRRMDARDLPPSNLVFLVDVSGSMSAPNKLPLVQQSLRMLVEQLRPQDRISLVVYAGAAGVVLEGASGDRREEVLDAVERLQAGGSTAGGAGIRLAYDVARRHHREGGNNRVVLATDGDFNVGVSSDSEMFRLVEEKRAQGTFLTVLGFGMGNLKDSKLEGLADRGNGNYAYIDDVGEARKVLVSEMGGTLFTIAKDVKLQVEFNPERVAGYRLIGYENRMLRAEDFDDDRKDAGELGAGHSVTAIYEVVPVGARTRTRIRGVERLRYQRPAARSGASGGGELAFVKLRYKAPDGAESRLLSHPVAAGEAGARSSDDFRFSAAVASFGMLLRGSEHKGTSSPGQVLSLARGALADDPHGYRAEFVRMVERFQTVSREGSRDPDGEDTDR